MSWVGLFFDQYNFFLTLLWFIFVFEMLLIKKAKDSRKMIDFCKNLMMLVKNICCYQCTNILVKILWDIRALLICNKPNIVVLIFDRFQDDYLTTTRWNIPDNHLILTKRNHYLPTCFCLFHILFQLMHTIKSN